MEILLNENHLSIFDHFRVYFQGKSENRLKFGDSIFFEKSTVIEPYTTFFRGFNVCSIGSFSFIRSPVQRKLLNIGRYCSISLGVKVMGINHPLNRFSTSSITYDKRMISYRKALEDNPQSAFLLKDNQRAELKPVAIGNDVWIGENVTLSQGINIGDGSVIAAGSIVTKDVEPYSIVGGVPAKFIRYRFNEDIISRLISLKFWKYAYWDFGGFDQDQEIERFIDRIEFLLSVGQLKEYVPPVLRLENLVDIDN